MYLCIYYVCMDGWHAESHARTLSRTETGRQADRQAHTERDIEGMNAKEEE